MGDVEKLKLLRADKMSTSNIDENEDEDRAISVDITKENFLFQGRLKRFLHIGQISQLATIRLQDSNNKTSG